MRLSSLVRITAATIVLALPFALPVFCDEKQDQEKLDAIRAGLAKVEARLVEFDALYKKCQAKGIRLDYPTVTKTTLGQFIPWAKEDLENKCIWRSEYAVKDMGNSLDWAIADMKAYLKDPSLAPKVRRYQTSKLDVRGLSLIGDRKDSSGKVDRGPVFFVGYGHFNDARENMPRWPGYGINMIQSAEMLPGTVLPEENKVDMSTVDQLRKTLDDAARHNVKVDVLLSLQCMCEWALRKWPALRDGGGTFVNFDVDAPEGNYVLRKYLSIVIPLIKDHPALNSFCLTNEPSFTRVAVATTGPMWKDYLIRVHGDIKALNGCYGTSYASFDEVPIPGGESYDAPQFYDWCAFNQERFAAWHARMAYICHELAPNVPVHTKMQSVAIPHRQTISWGLDPELFGRFSDIYGNDCSIWPAAQSFSGPGWSMPFHGQNINYDLQRSLARKPIIDSENHPTDDTSTCYMPPDYFRNALWQGAIHGQDATTMWVWQRAKPWVPGYEPTFIGNVIDRPGCAEASGMTCLDLNRFADEVTALQNVKAPVAVLFSIPSICKTWDYIWAMRRFYAALNSCGVKIDFISERQTAQGKAKDYRMILVPCAPNVLPSTFEAMQNLPEATKLVLSGNSLAKDQYDRPYPTEVLAAIRARAISIESSSTDGKDIFPRLYQELGKTGGLSEYSVIDVATGKPAWGVEWLPAKVGGRTVINMTNLTDKPITVKVLLRGKGIAVRDLFSLGGKQPAGLLKPMQVVLGEVAR